MKIRKFPAATNHITTANGTTVMQDASGNLGLFNTSGTEVLVLPNGSSLVATLPALNYDGSNLELSAPLGQQSGLAIAKSYVLYVNASGVNFIKPISSFNNIFTAGLGVPAIYAAYSQTGKTAAVTNAINYTPPATAGTYRLSFSVDVTTATTDNFTVVATWKDASGNAISQNLGGSDKNGTALTAGAITNAIGRGVYYGSALFSIDNSATAITLSTAGTFTTVTYNLAATLEQLA